MKSRILLLRHGQIQANVDGHWHGSTDSALTDFGVRQAKETGSFLEKNANIGKVFSSPLQRCLHTAHHASGFDLEDIEIVPGFAEMSIGDWEGKKYRQLQIDHQLNERCTQDPQWRPPNGESLADVALRMRHSIEQIVRCHSDGSTVLVVSHGAAMAIALATLLHGDPSKWGDYHFNNCGLTELKLAGEASLGQFNDCSHLGMFG